MNSHPQTSPSAYAVARPHGVWQRALRCAAAGLLLCAGMYLSAFFAGWTFHPAVAVSIGDVAFGLGFAAALGAVTVWLARLVAGWRARSWWLLLGLTFPVLAAAYLR